ncbi:MAG: dienelactone hydrolase family protein [Bacteroidetes bacterium]|nr:dienelactone hydrolase family protein [Bacteroidota bacterium]
MTNSTFRKIISIPIGKIKLEGELIIPNHSKSLVIFSHGSGSSRFSTRNNFVAKELHKQNISTFLFDLLTKEEDELYSNRFNIDLLTERLIIATKYMSTLQECSELRIGYFGASTGAASALRAAASLPKMVEALVSRGGRPDLAIDIAPKIKIPTLLIVGERDYDVLNLNKEVYEILICEKKLAVIPGATHLFEEQGTLNEAAIIAADWFNIFLQNEKKETITIQ